MPEMPRLFFRTRSAQGPDVGDDEVAWGWICEEPLDAGGLAEAGLDRGARPMIVAVAAPATPDALLARLAGEPDGVLVPGIQDGAELQRLDARLAVAEAERGWCQGRLGLWVEAGASPAAVFRLGTLTGATPRLRGLVWREAGLAAAMGIPAKAEAVRIAQSLVVLAAHAAGVPALFDAGSSPVEAAALRQDGFAGLIREV